MNHHHNTTKESAETLEKFESKAKSQEIEIFELFESLKQGSPSYIGAIINQLRPTPITSIRRAISNLTRDGYLIKTDKKVTGLYGRSEFQWKLNESGIVRVKSRVREIANKVPKTAYQDFQQLELQFAEVSTRCNHLEANNAILESMNDVVTKSNELLRIDNAKLKQAVDVCHEQIEKLNKQLIGKDKEIDFLHGRINELNRKHNANK